MASTPRLVYAATDPVTAYRVMDGQLAYMKSRGFEVTVVTAPGPLLTRVAEREGVAAVGVPMNRAISPADDIVSLARLVDLFRRTRPDIVFAGTPKAGLLGVTAARLARVPHVIYHLRGLRYATASGLKRRTLVATEHVAARLAELVVCNGESLRREFVRDGFVPLEKTWVPAFGTSNGVDVERFTPNAATRSWAAAERQRMKIAPDAMVIGFVGRFTRDKGLRELARALQSIPASRAKLHLLAVGDFDATDPVPADVRHWMKTSPDVTITGYVEEPARFYSMMDVFAFPSHREGFPNAPLEAASARLPTVAFRAVGTVDAVVDGRTGMLVDIGDVPALAERLLTYCGDAELRATHGNAARERAMTQFRREIVWAALADKLFSLAPTRGQARGPMRAACVEQQRESISKGTHAE